MISVVRNWFYFGSHQNITRRTFKRDYRSAREIFYLFNERDLSAIVFPKFTLCNETPYLNLSQSFNDRLILFAFFNIN